MKQILRIIDWFIKPALKTENDDHQKARLLVLVHLISLSYALIHIGVYYFTEYYIAIFALSLIFFSEIISLLLYRKYISNKFAINFILFWAIIGFTIFIYSSGGVFSPTISWLLPVSLLGFLFANRRSGYFWSTLSLLIISTFLVLNLLDFKFPMLMPGKWVNIHYALSFFGSSLFVLLIVVIYDTTNRIISKEILDKSQVLEQQKEEILAQNAELFQQKEEIEAQRDEITLQKDDIENKNKNLTDSIQYALRIQEAMLPPSEILSANLPEHFILYQPRDIVSGDFYWFKQIDNFIFIVAADCTGHGVPGAFMSLLGISHLNEIITKREINPANEILNELSERIKKSLHQEGQKGQTQDGMDIALCIIDIEHKTIQFSGAHNPLYLVRKNETSYELHETKADKMPIGVYPKENFGFTNNEIQLKSNDTIYIFSDGYVSQFGGTNLEKYKTKRLKELLTQIQDNDMKTQKEILEQSLLEWKGKQKQVDDILVIGIRLKP